MERTGFQRFLYNIWPTIYRVVNSAFYFLLNVIKKTVRLMIDQIKHG